MNEMRVLMPITKEDSRFHELIDREKRMREILETQVFQRLSEYLIESQVTFPEYLNIISLSISISRPTIVSRKMSQVWTNPFNPFIASILLN